MVHSTMNHMEKQVKKTLRDLYPLTKAIGQFIQYWGFRRIHGEIWTQVYLSNQPISGADLVKRLSVSKALISPALKQLVEYKLIFLIKSEDSREKRYQANSDFLSIIKEVLNKREDPLLNKIQVSYNKIQQSNENNFQIINQERLRLLGENIAVAKFAIGYLQHIESFEEIFLHLGGNHES